MAQVRLAHTAGLGPATLGLARGLMYDVFGPVLSDADWEHALGGMHALVWEEEELVGHGAVVQRQLIHAGRTLRTGYIEAVAVRAEVRGRGHGAAIMDALEGVIRAAYELGAMAASPEAAAFYLARRWKPWLGQTSALTPSGIIPARPETDNVYVLDVGIGLDPAGELTCDWRQGSLW